MPIKIAGNFCNKQGQGPGWKGLRGMFFFYPFPHYTRVWLNVKAVCLNFPCWPPGTGAMVNPGRQFGVQELPRAFYRGPFDAKKRDSAACNFTHLWRAGQFRSIKNRDRTQLQKGGAIARLGRNRLNGIICRDPAKTYLW